MTIAGQIRDDVRTAVKELETNFLSPGDLVGGRNFFEERLHGTHFLSRWRDLVLELHAGPALVADVHLMREALNDQDLVRANKILRHLKVDLAQSTLPDEWDEKA